MCTRSRTRGRARFYRRSSRGVLFDRKPSRVRFIAVCIRIGLPDLRTVSLKGYPYLVFYRDQPGHVAVGRVLHAKRDIPQRMKSRTVTERSDIPVVGIYWWAGGSRPLKAGRLTTGLRNFDRRSRFAPDDLCARAFMLMCPHALICSPPRCGSRSLKREEILPLGRKRMSDPSLASFTAGHCNFRISGPAGCHVLGLSKVC